MKKNDKMQWLRLLRRENVMSLSVLQGPNSPEITLLLPRRSGHPIQSQRAQVIKIISLLENYKLLLGQGCQTSCIK